MASGLRELRQRRKSVSSTKKITKAMELIAASKIVKAQHAAVQALPFTRELNRAVSAVAVRGKVQHPLTTPKVENPKRVALLFIGNGKRRLVELGGVQVDPKPELLLALQQLPFVNDTYEVDYLTPPA